MSDAQEEHNDKHEQEPPAPARAPLTPARQPATPMPATGYQDNGLLTPSGTIRGLTGSERPRLQSKASTAVSLTDIYTLPHHDFRSGGGGGGSSSNGRTSGVSTPGHNEQAEWDGTSKASASASLNTQTASGSSSTSHTPRLSARNANSEAGDTASIRSIRSMRSLRSVQGHASQHADVDSLLGGISNEREDAFDGINDTGRTEQPISAPDLFPVVDTEDVQLEELFRHEFDELEELQTDGSNEESLMVRWRCKLKHFLILSSAGKPIYSRHGDDQLISNHIGVMQTIISSFIDAGDSLSAFTAGDARFAILSKGHLHLVAISRIEENDSQLRGQLESLYTQILSTLTLPSMERMFINRPSTDLRRPLEGTASLLSALADDFTRGSPSALLTAIECLRMRKAQREVVNQTMVKCKKDSLLYGLIVAGGRLVSVIRPKKHSLHPGDLHIVFNMLFKAGGVRAGGGENWIPLCLPGFNNTGYIYMYVSFLNQNQNQNQFAAAGDPETSTSARPTSASSSTSTTASNGNGKEADVDNSESDNDIVIVLISPSKDSFFDMRQMRDELVAQLERNGSMQIIRSSLSSDRPSCTEIHPQTVIQHFLYKSRANVQFVAPRTISSLQSPYSWRRLISLYSVMHGAVHGKTSHLKIHHCKTDSYVSLAWAMPTFELYCVAAPSVSRDSLVFSANKIEQWARREQERLFIIGGAVF